MSAKSLVQQWKDKAARRAAAQRSVSVTFAGFTGKAHRLPLLTWASAGKLPQYLTEAMFAAAQGKSTQVKEQDLTPAEMAEWLRFQCTAFCSMMDEPKFTTDEKCADDEINYMEFLGMCPEVVREAVQWQINGCPNIPVQTESGEVAVDDLKKFRRSRKRASVAQLGTRSGEVWWQTVASPRIM